jgi:EAL domain-containing protein (putative c-di-GMP-specific phosphodiesterase class I)
MITTAEGVETLEQAAFLRQEGCDQLQGYYFSRPVTADDLTAFMATWNRNKQTDEVAA